MTGSILPIKRHRLSEMRPVPRRGLSRAESAMYIGVSVSKFDEMVKDGRMPQPIALDARKVWDLRKLDAAFDALDEETPDRSWDNFGSSQKS